MKYKQSVYKTFALISQLGISILVPILLCTFFGTWLEKKVSFPVFIPLVIVGVLAGGDFQKKSSLNQLKRFSTM